ncbi:MAG: DUF1521 domain-containing protein [Deltaproteobacteria bacterium]
MYPIRNRDPNEHRIHDIIAQDPPTPQTEGGLEKVPEQGDEKQRVETPDGYQVAVNRDNTVQIYDPAGELIASISGNRVFEAASGEFFNFGDDSSFILPDGTKISLDLEATNGNRDRIAAVDVISGNDRLHVGEDGVDGITQDGVEFDAENRDAAPGNNSGVFALQDNGEFAVLERDGEFYDVRGLDPSVRNFLDDDTTVRSDLSSPASGITARQQRALDGAANTEEFGELLDALSDLLDRIEVLLGEAEDTGGAEGAPGADTGEIEDLLKQLLEALLARTEGSTSNGDLTELLEKLLEALQGGVGGNESTSGNGSPTGPGNTSGSGSTSGPGGTPAPPESPGGGDFGGRISDLLASGVDAEILITVILALLVEVLNDKLIDKAKELDERTRNNVEGGGESGEGGETEGVFGDGPKGTELLSRELQQIQENLSALKLLTNTILDNKNQVAQQLYS